MAGWFYLFKHHRTAHHCTGLHLNDSAALNIMSVWNIGISNCTFQNNTNNGAESSEYGFGGTIHVHNSNLTLVESIFHRNFAYKGGELEVFTNSTASLSRNTFTTTQLIIMEALFLHIQTTPSPSQRTYFRIILLILPEVLFLHI